MLNLTLNTPILEDTIGTMTKLVQNSGAPALWVNLSRCETGGWVAGGGPSMLLSVQSPVKTRTLLDSHCGEEFSGIARSAPRPEHHLRRAGNSLRKWVRRAKSRGGRIEASVGFETRPPPEVRDRLIGDGSQNKKAN